MWTVDNLIVTKETSYFTGRNFQHTLKISVKVAEMIQGIRSPAAHRMHKHQLQTASCFMIIIITAHQLYVRKEIWEEN